MKKSLYLLFISLFLVNSSIYAQCDWWVKSYGGELADNVTAMEVDDAGNVYITGSFSGSADFGDISVTSYGDKDVFVAKINKDGVPVWVKNAGGIYEDEANDIAIDNNGNIYITGYYNSTATFGAESITSSGGEDLFIVKYSNSGSFSWVISGGSYDNYSTSDDIGHSINFSGSQLYVSGRNVDYMLSGADTTVLGINYNNFLGKINTDGSIDSAKIVYYNGYDEFLSKVDNNGNVYVTGHFSNKINLAGDELVSNGGNDVFLAKYNENLECLWVKKMGVVVTKMLILFI